MLYLKALHIIFVVTWFAGMFYIVRLFIYQREAQDKDEPERSILTKQFSMMAKRLWFGITWPSAVLTLIFGPLCWYYIWRFTMPDWLNVKLGFVLGLYAYFFSLHAIFRQQAKGIYTWSSQKLRVWNEVATIFLIAIVMLATVKDGMSWLWGILGLIGFVVILMSAIKVYKMLRARKTDN